MIRPSSRWALVRNAIDRLNPVERWVIRERFGIGPIDAAGAERPASSREQLSRSSGLSPEQIITIEWVSIDKLREILAPYEDAIFDATPRPPPPGAGSPHYVPEETSPSWENMIRAIEDRGC